MIFLKWYLIILIGFVLIAKLFYKIERKCLRYELGDILFYLIVFYIPILTYIIFN